jgi:hypothetical protein
MIGKCPLVLEDCTHLLELDPESCTKSEVMDIRIEEFVDRKEEEDLVCFLLGDSPASEFYI